MKILGSVQPSYLAWLPLFARINASNVFVYLDNVEYSKNSFHNRNRIKTAQGELSLTAPVKYSGNSTALLNKIQTDDAQPWKKKHWKTITQSYRKSEHFNEFSESLEQIYTSSHNSLADLNIELIDLFCIYLGINTPTYRASELNPSGSANDMLINLCAKLDASHFIVKPNTDNYHSTAYFNKHGIEMHYWQHQTPVYPQLYATFTPNLSALDFAANCGPNSFSKFYIN